ncbi:MAG: flagellar hook-basal body complex protein FliE [Candidatus Zixiibacteriota bacterium]
MAGGINSINRLVPGLIEQGKTNPTAKPAEGEEKFTDLLSNFVNSVNEAQQNAVQAQNAFLNGEPVELHDVMIKAEEAGLAMDLLLEIRNKLLDAFDTMMKMPM